MSSIVVLTGGVGGAKLVLGLVNVVPAARVTAIVNTGDDFRHFGLHVSPDIDTLLYTLSGRANVQQGWGREGETWAFMEMARSLDEEDWFALGDGDLALHVMRSMRLARGDRLSDVTARFARCWGIGANISPMSDDPVATWVSTAQGDLEFQRYFVEQRCAPEVVSISYRGAETARPAPGVVAAIMDAECVIVAPSNPWLSIAPILAIQDIAAALRATTAPVVAVSPLVAGKAVKGPTAKIMAELGLAPDNAAIAAFYRDVLDGLVVDQQDDYPDDLPSYRTHTLMSTLDDKRRVAEAALSFARSLRAR